MSDPNQKRLKREKAFLRAVESLRQIARTLNWSISPVEDEDMKSGFIIGRSDAVLLSKELIKKGLDKDAKET